MRVAERAYTLLKSEAHNEPIEDWVASQHGGPDMALVFEAANGANLDTVRVPGFFTYDGFYVALLDRCTTIADKLQKENWVLGPSGEQSAVKQQYSSLFPDILELYGKRFHRRLDGGARQSAIGPLLADKPKYLALERRLGADLADPADLRIRPRRDGADPRAQKPRRTPADAGQGERLPRRRLANSAGSGEAGASTSRMKSQRTAGDPPPRCPAPSIEANFKPFQILVDGEPGARPMDALLANLNELYRAADAGGDQSGAGEAGARPGRRSRSRACAPTSRACRSRSPA